MKQADKALVDGVVTRSCRQHLWPVVSLCPCTLLLLYPGIYLIIDGALEMHITSLIDLITEHTCVTLVGVKPQRDGKGESMHETFSVQDVPATRTGKCVHACTHPA